MSTSAIVYTTINENFPAAGQDNDSQGFRDNFARIKTALGTAQTEVTYLNNNAVDKTKNNDMGNNTQSNLILKNFGVASNSALASAATTSVITFSEYHYRRYSLGNTENVFQVDNWPVGCYSEILLAMVASTGTKRASFQPGVVNSSLGSVTTKIHLGAGFGNNNYMDLTRLDGSGKLQTYLFKVSTPDGGVNTYVSLVDTFKEQA
jgi:hypothetical protein